MEQVGIRDPLERQPAKWLRLSGVGDGQPDFVEPFVGSCWLILFHDVAEALPIC